MSRQMILGFSNLVFNKGVATLGKQPFSGVVKDVLKSGGHIETVFENGKAVVTKRCGDGNNFTKIWDRAKDRVYTYCSDLYVDHNFNIRGKIGTCDRIASKDGNLFTVQTPSGRYTKIYNTDGKRSIIMSTDRFGDVSHVNVLENGKVISHNTPYRTGTELTDTGAVLEYGALDRNGKWTQATADELNDIIIA